MVSMYHKHATPDSEDDIPPPPQVPPPPPPPPPSHTAGGRQSVFLPSDDSVDFTRVSSRARATAAAGPPPPPPPSNMQHRASFISGGRVEPVVPVSSTPPTSDLSRPLPPLPSSGVRRVSLISTSNHHRANVVRRPSFLLQTNPLLSTIENSNTIVSPLAMIDEPEAEVLLEPSQTRPLPLPMPVTSSIENDRVRPPPPPPTTNTQKRTGTSTPPKSMQTTKSGPPPIPDSYCGPRPPTSQATPPLPHPRSTPSPSPVPTPSPSPSPSSSPLLSSSPPVSGYARPPPRTAPAASNTNVTVRPPPGRIVANRIAAEHQQAGRTNGFASTPESQSTPSPIQPHHATGVVLGGIVSSRLAAAKFNPMLLAPTGFGAPRMGAPIIRGTANVPAHSHRPSPSQDYRGRVTPLDSNSILIRVFLPGREGHMTFNTNGIKDLNFLRKKILGKLERSGRFEDPCSSLTRHTLMNPSNTKFRLIEAPNLPLEMDLNLKDTLTLVTPYILIPILSNKPRMIEMELVGMGLETPILPMNDRKDAYHDLNIIRGVTNDMSTTIVEQSNSHPTPMVHASHSRPKAPARRRVGGKTSSGELLKTGGITKFTPTPNTNMT